VILLARTLVRIVSFLLLTLLAAAGLVIAVFSIGEGTDGLSYAQLADLLRLPELRDTVGGWLAQLEAPEGGIAQVAALAGLGAMLLGAILLAGVLVPRRERLVTLDTGKDGAVVARRRPLAQIAGTLVDQVRGVTLARVKVRPRRGTGGTIKVRAQRSRRAQDRDVERAVQEELADLTGPFRLRTRVRLQQADRGHRVQ
jgi:hypothetical protein